MHTYSAKFFEQLQLCTTHVHNMATNLPEVPDAPNVFLEALQDEEIASMLQYEANRRRVDGRTTASRLQKRVKERSRTAIHEERLRARPIAAPTGLDADTEEWVYVTGI